MLFTDETTVYSENPSTFLWEKRKMYWILIILEMYTNLISQKLFQQMDK